MKTQVLAFENEFDDDIEHEASDVEEENPSDEEEEDIHPEGKTSLVSRRALQIQVQEEEAHEQRENIFLTRCKIKDEVCTMIIDGGSETNTISIDLVKKLGLKTTRHPLPYKLSWLEKSKSCSVRKQCHVSFSIGNYKDDVTCDVIPMDASDILLGRPWQSDRRSLHNGYLNTYTISYKGKKLTLHPLPPIRQPQTPQNNKEHSLLSLKEFEREIEEEGELYLLYSKELHETFVQQNPQLAQLIKEFEDVFPDELP